MPCRGHARPHGTGRAPACRVGTARRSLRVRPSPRRYPRRLEPRQAWVTASRRGVARNSVSGCPSRREVGSGRRERPSPSGRAVGRRRSERACAPWGEAGSVRQPMRPGLGGGALGHRHAVFGERAGLVGAQHGGRAQRLDGGGAPGQHSGVRDAPGAHRHEHRKHERELLGQHGHADGDAREHSVEPAAAEQAVEHDQQAHRDAEHPKTRRCGGSGSAVGRLGLHAPERAADLADLAPAPVAVNPAIAGARARSVCRRRERRSSPPARPAAPPTLLAHRRRICPSAGIRRR